MSYETINKITSITNLVGNLRLLLENDLEKQQDEQVLINFTSN